MTLRALRRVAANPPDWIADTMPPEYMLGNREAYVRAIRASIPMYSPDGRIERKAAGTALNVLLPFDKHVKKAKIDLAATDSNVFVEKAPQR